MQSLLLQIDITEIVLHKTDKPNAVVDLFDADRLTRERSAEIYFLLENADPSAAGDKNSAIVERIGEFADAAIRPRGRFVDIGRALHIESLMRALVVKFMNEGIELGLLLKEVRTGRAGSLHL